MKSVKNYSLITKKEAADLLSVSLPTINRRIKDGSIPIVRIGSAVRIPQAFIEKLITQALPGQGVE